MEALRQYLQAMPKLADTMLEHLGEIVEKEKVDYNKVDDMREACARALDAAVNELKSRQVPYYAVTYPQVYFKCEDCREEVKGAYYEISNPVTNARGVFRTRLMHALLAHGQTSYVEPILNQSETKLGEDHHPLDVKKLMGILKGLPLPDAVTQELQAGLAAAGK